MPRVWDPSPKDAISLAAFRWFANTIENCAIELYATERKSFKEVERVLRATLRELERIRVSHVIPEEENGCPDGYVLCHGICRPSCDDVEAVAAVNAERRSSKGEKSSKKR